MSTLISDRMSTNMFERPFNPYSSDQTFFTQARSSPNEGGNKLYSDEMIYPGSSLDYLSLGYEDQSNTQYTFANPPTMREYLQNNADLDQFIQQGELSTPGGTLPFTFPGHAELDPRLIVQNGNNYNLEGVKSQADLPDTTHPAKSSAARRLHVSSQGSKNNGDQKSYRHATIQHGQLTPNSPRSPTTVESNSDTSENSGSVARESKPAKSLKRKAEAEQPEEGVLPKPKRGRKSKKAKVISKEEQQAQREKFLERNRNAAAKCRVNKKHWQENLKDKVKELGTQHAQLSAEFAQLQQEYDGLRAFLIPHSRVCPDQKLQTWLDRHVQVAFPRSPPAALSKNFALSLDQATEDPSIARVNTDYTDKRIIEMPSPVGVAAAFQGIGRPRSAPMTPSAVDVKPEPRLRAQSISTPGEMGMNFDMSPYAKSLSSNMSMPYKGQSDTTYGADNQALSKSLFDESSMLSSPGYFDQVH